LGFPKAKEYARANNLHWGAFQSIETVAKQVAAALIEAKLIPASSARTSREHQYGGADLNTYSKSPHIIKAVLAAGLYPRLAVRSGAHAYMWRTSTEARVVTHPQSTLYTRADAQAHAGPRGRTAQSIGVFDALLKSVDGNDTYVRNTTSVSPLAVALFCGRLTSGGRETSYTNSNVIKIDDWLPLYLQSEDQLVTRTIIETRKGLERMLVKAYADLSKRQPLGDDPVRAVFSSGIIDILSLACDEQGSNQRRSDPRSAHQPNVLDMLSQTFDARRHEGSPSAAKSKQDPKMEARLLEWEAQWEARTRARQRQQAARLTTTGSRLRL